MMVRTVTKVREIVSAIFNFKLIRMTIIITSPMEKGLLPRKYNASKAIMAPKVFVFTWFHTCFHVR